MSSIKTTYVWYCLFSNKCVLTQQIDVLLVFLMLTIVLFVELYCNQIKTISFMKMLEFNSFTTYFSFYHSTFYSPVYTRTFNNNHSIKAIYLNH